MSRGNISGPGGERDQGISLTGHRSSDVPILPCFWLSFTDMWAPYLIWESIQCSNPFNASMILFFEIQIFKCLKNLEEIYMCSQDVCLPSLIFSEPNSKCT
jgi:hypothetical protein